MCKLITLIITRTTAKWQSSVHHVARGLFITLQHPAFVILMYSSVHHFTGGLFTVLRHPAWKADKKKFSENHARAEERQGIRTCKHCFQYPIPVYQLLVYTMIVWLRASKVKQTWRAFETPTPHILPFGHEKRFFWKWVDWGN